VQAISSILAGPRQPYRPHLGGSRLQVVAGRPGRNRGAPLCRLEPVSPGTSAELAEAKRIGRERRRRLMTGGPPANRRRWAAVAPSSGARTAAPPRQPFQTGSRIRPARPGGSAAAAGVTVARAVVSRGAHAGEEEAAYAANMRHAHGARERSWRWTPCALPCQRRASGPRPQPFREG
jgi:hypothetical protein